MSPNPWANYQGSAGAVWETLQPDTGTGPCPDDDPEKFETAGGKGRSDQPGYKLVVDNVWEDIGRFRSCGRHSFMTTFMEWCQEAGVPMPSYTIEAMRGRSDFGSISVLMTYKDLEHAKEARRKMWGWWGDCPKEYQELGWCFYKVRFWGCKRPARFCSPPVEPTRSPPGPPPGPPPADAMYPPPWPAHEPEPQEPEPQQPQEPEPQEPEPQEPQQQEPEPQQPQSPAPQEQTAPLQQPEPSVSQEQTAGDEDTEELQERPAECAHA